MVFYVVEHRSPKLRNHKDRLRFSKRCPQNLFREVTLLYFFICQFRMIGIDSKVLKVDWKTRYGTRNVHKNPISAFFVYVRLVDVRVLTIFFDLLFLLVEHW